MKRIFKIIFLKSAITYVLLWLESNRKITQNCFTVNFICYWHQTAVEISLFNYISTQYSKIDSPFPLGFFFFCLFFVFKFVASIFIPKGESELSF